MRYKQNLKAILLAVVVSTAPSMQVALAEQLEPGHGNVQSQADWTGVIEHIGKGGNTIVVDDREFTIPPGAVIHGTRSGRSAIRKGMRVDIRTQPGNVASEIWIR